VSKRLVFFNHKGGVSKTTSVYNIGWKLAETHRVLLVDGDPQCNLTSLVLRDSFEEYYTESATRLANIKDGVSPAFTGKPVPISAVTCPSAARNGSLFVLPGHANLSEFDASLTFAQNSNNAIATLQNLPGAFNRLIELCEQQHQIDYTLIDLNPGLSAINQNLFLNSDFFVVPTNPDPFSIMAIETLSSVLPRWATWKTSATTAFDDSAYPLRDGSPRFIGIFAQRFNVRNGKAARPYRDNIEEIKQRVIDSLFPSLESVGMTLDTPQYPQNLVQQSYCVGEIPDFGGLLPKAFNAGAPVFALTDADINESGPVLQTLRTKANQLNGIFDAVAHSLVEMMAYE